MSPIPVAEKPHAVCVPFPAQGHINPMMKLAKLLHRCGFHITFVNTEFNHRRLLRSRGPTALDGTQGFRFRTIPDGLPMSDTNATQDIPSVCCSTQSTCSGPFRELVRELNQTDSLPVSCIVADGAVSFTLDAAKEFGLPEVMLWTASVCGVLAYFHIPELIRRGLTPVKDPSYLTDDKYMDAVMDWLPGPRNVIRFRDLPSFIRTTDPNDMMMNYLVKEIKRSYEASAIVLNTFDPFECQVLDALSTLNLPPLYPIGPLNLLVDETASDDGLTGIRSSLWTEEPECLEWLDTKEPDSVVYVNFGSITVMSREQLVEFAWGLADSKKPFLWVLRPDLVNGESAVLPTEFLREIGGRGMLAAWCPQEEVLKHSAVGGFLSHMGWNSTLETVCGGVPTVCWPFFAEQQMNCRFACREWGIGIEIGGDVRRGKLERLVNELMEGEKGVEMRVKVREWKKMAELAVAEGGSSRRNLEDVIQKVLLVPKRP